MSGVATAIVGSAVIGLGGQAYMANKAAKTAKQAAEASQVDVDKLDEQTRRIARQNAMESAELERQLTPEVPLLRSTANKAVIAGLNDSGADKYRAALEARLGMSLDTPLLKEAINKARSDLALGGNLSTDVQNAVTRRSIANAGAVSGGANLGLGRDVTARDLGLTSLQLERDRLSTALSAGESEQGLATDNSTNLLNTISLLNQINGQKQNYALNAAGFGESIQQPIVGLDPASVADVVSGNATNRGAALSNQAAIYGQQGQGIANFAGQMGGAFLGYKAATAKK